MKKIPKIFGKRCEKLGEKYQRKTWLTILMSFFSNIGADLAEKMNNILWEPAFDCVHYKFTFSSITEDDVRKTVKSLSIFKASSVPDINSKVLKDAFLV